MATKRYDSFQYGMFFSDGHVRLRVFTYIKGNGGRVEGEREFVFCTVLTY